MRSSQARRPPGWLVDGAGLAAALVLLALAARRLGFDHVSDDDFARVTIAQRFVASPRLDPTGTSWLPIPFYWSAAFLAVFGRTLGAARAGALVAACAGVVFVAYAAERAGLSRRARIVGGLATLVTPWTAWLASAPVPELPTTALLLGAALLAGARRREGATLVAAGAATFLACLSRYEAWPVAMVVAGAAAVRARARPSRLAEGLLAASALLGPALWIGWNAHAHGDALHFFHRVARYKLALDGGATPALDGWLFYPRVAIASFAPLLVVALAAAIAARRTIAIGELAVPTVAALGQLVFLAAGNARGGAPTHHAERALLLVAWLLAFVIGAALDALWRSTGRAAQAAVGATVTAGALRAVTAIGAHIPGTGPEEVREAQIARGLALRGAAAVEIEPCSYEHFALMAAFGAPERVVVHEPEARARVTPACPTIVRVAP